MLLHMVGMWALIIWDKESKRIFVSRSRFGQKPLYVRKVNEAWLFASEIKPLLGKHEKPAFDPTAIVEFLALGNYGHLGAHTFFKDIRQFPQGSYMWFTNQTKEVAAIPYWELPDINDKDKRPFDDVVKKGLHDRIVEAVLSETLSDVPIGITLSGGVDSSIIAGILATYYDKEINIFTAQSKSSKYDETKYVEAVIEKYGKNKFIVHRKNTNELSIKDDLERYIKIQEEPFGDPSIIAHGSLMKMSADAGIKVILNGQGADEFFFGYNNMAQAILSLQFRSLHLSKFSNNLSGMKMSNGYLMRTLLKSVFPTLEFNLRTKSRIKRRDIIRAPLLDNVDNNLVSLYKYNNVYNVWRESIYGVHLPHLVHYDDRNAMAYSIEGRMPFLDHRVAEYVATIKSEDFIKKGLRKYILRESCKQYMPESVYNRRDKIGFYTPLINVLTKDSKWVTEQLQSNTLLKADYISELIGQLTHSSLTINEALQIWRCVSVNMWMDDFNVKH
jgi:asparagine synthase (glutamine-hydrolysing)